MTDKEKQLIIDYGIVSDTDSGRNVLADLREKYDPSIAKLSVGNPDETAFWLGQRSVILYIINQINTDPNKELQTDYETETGGADYEEE